MKKGILIAFGLLGGAMAQAQVYKDKTAPIEKRVDALIKAMTLEEKIDYIGGQDPLFIRAIPRLGIPQIKMSDGPVGVGAWGPTTVYPAGVSAAASWDTSLIRHEGIALGRDARARGVHILLAPGVNIYRAPMCGRNFEYFGEDPYLASRMAVGYIKGVQSQKVMAVVKHFAANNQEWDRHNVSSDVDDRTLNEIYLPAFKAAVQEAKVASVMNSYNLLNGVHTSQSLYLLDTILRQNWGFKGFVMSDWASTYDGVAAAKAGLDLEMPNAQFMNRATLLPAIKNGTLSEAVIDAKIRRILTALFLYGFYDRVQLDSVIPQDDPTSAAASLNATRGGMVLLKNQGLLPFGNNVKNIAVLGPNAIPYIYGGGSSAAQPFHAVGALEGMQKQAGAGVTVKYVDVFSDLLRQSVFYNSSGSKTPGLKAEYFSNPYLSGVPSATRTETVINHTWEAEPDVAGIPADRFAIRYTGVVKAKKSQDYRFVVIGDDGYNLWVDGKKVIDEWHAQASNQQECTLHFEAGTEHAIKLEYFDGGGIAQIAFGYIKQEDNIAELTKAELKNADAVVVCAGMNAEFEGEYHDRPFELPNKQDSIITMAASANPNTVVVINAGGNVYMQPWINNIKGLLYAWYPGQEGGIAIGEILFGKVNPSGKLPVTFEKEWKDNPVYNSYYDPNKTGHVKYTEGLFVGYRGYEKNKVTPQFPFGFGLSYTTFQYSNLKIVNISLKGKVSVSVSFDVRNSGTLDGAEVAQLYVHQQKCDVERPYKELKGFSKVFLKAGETKRITILLDESAFAYYTTGLGFYHDAGAFDILIGASSADIKLNGTVTLKQ